MTHQSGYIHQRSDLAPRVSVVIPSFNHGQYIEECLSSILSQSYQDLEIVVTDDGSSDDSVAILNATEDPRLRLEAFPKNRGASVAHNNAIARSRGEYIALLNSDDAFLPGKLELQVAFLDEHPEIGAVFGLPSFVDDEGRPYDDPAHKDHSAFLPKNRDRHAWLREFFDHGNCLCHPTSLIRRQCYEELGFYDERLAQVPDFDMWIRLCSRFDIHVLDVPLTRFRIRSGLKNASAARPEVLVRDVWERSQILRHYLELPESIFEKVFPEQAGSSRPPAIWLAQHALSLGTPFHDLFGLAAWFNAIGPQNAEGGYQDFIAATGAHDPCLIRAFKSLELQLVACRAQLQAQVLPPAAGNKRVKSFLKRLWKP